MCRSKGRGDLGPPQFSTVKVLKWLKFCLTHPGLKLDSTPEKKISVSVHVYLTVQRHLGNHISVHKLNKSNNNVHFLIFAPQNRKSKFCPICTYNEGDGLAAMTFIRLQMVCFLTSTKYKTIKMERKWPCFFGLFFFICFYIWH